MSLRRQFLITSSALALNVALDALSHEAAAGCTISSTTSVPSGVVCGSPTVYWTGGNLSIGSTASIAVGGQTGLMAQSNAGTLLNSGTISISSGSNWALNVQSLVASIDNGGTISGGSWGGMQIGAGSLTALTDEGVITGGAVGLSNAVVLDVSSIANTGTIHGSASGITNTGTIGTLTNSGTITGADYGIKNTGTITTLSNSGSIASGYTVNMAGIENTSTITFLLNDGTISGGIGVYNSSTGTISSFSNTNSVNGFTGLKNAGTIGTLTNSGTISGGSNDGLLNSGTIGTLNISGVVSSTNAIAIGNSGSIGTILNSGTISGFADAISIGSAGGIGTITNSGLIAGNILSNQTADLTINGGTGSVGTLTGYTTTDAGTISATGNVVFGSGTILLNDDISASGHTVTNSSATIQLNNSRTITGAYSQTGGGLIIAETSSTSYGQISVTGTASISNTAITISGTGLVSGEVFTIAKAGTGSYSGNSVYLTETGYVVTSAVVGNLLEVEISTYADIARAEGGAAVGMGTALDSLSSSTNTQVTTLLSKLSALSRAEQQTAIKQLAPTQITPGATASSQAASPAGSVVEQHELALLNDGGAGAAAGSDGKADWIWGQIIGGAAIRDTTADQTGFRSQNMGLVIGYDWQQTTDLVLGAAISYIKSWSWGMDTDAGSLTKLNSYQLLTYGIQRLDNVFIDGQIVGGINSYDQRREIGFIDESARAKYLGGHVSAKVGTGYDVPLDDDKVLTPIAGLRFTRAMTNSYTESGAEAADLNITRNTTQNLTQDVGAKLTYKVNTCWGQLSPEFRVAWVHDYTQGVMTTSGDMAGAAFSSSSARPSSDGVRLNLAMGMEGVEDMNLRVEYEGEIRHDYESHTGLVKASWGF